MDTSDYLKELTQITYDREALEQLYHSIKHRAINYIERHAPELDVSDNPYARCICPKCLPIGKHQHSGDGHKVIRHMERFNHPEINRLITELQYVTKTSVPNWPTLWVYGPGFHLPPHKDVARTNSIIVPILPTNGGATVTIYQDDLPIIQKEHFQTVEHNPDYVHEVHQYSLIHPTVLYANRVIHGVQNGPDERVFLNFTGYGSWDDI